MANWLRNPLETPSAARPGRSGFNSTIRMRWLCSATSKFKRSTGSRLREAFHATEVFRSTESDPAFRGAGRHGFVRLRAIEAHSATDKERRQIHLPCGWETVSHPGSPGWQLQRFPRPDGKWEYVTG